MLNNNLNSVLNYFSGLRWRYYPRNSRVISLNDQQTINNNGGRRQGSKLLIFFVFNFHFQFLRFLTVTMTNFIAISLRWMRKQADIQDRRRYSLIIRTCFQSADFGFVYTFVPCLCDENIALSLYESFKLKKKVHVSEIPGFELFNVL